MHFQRPVVPRCPPGKRMPCCWPQDKPRLSVGSFGNALGRPNNVNNYYEKNGTRTNLLDPLSPARFEMGPITSLNVMCTASLAPCFTLSLLLRIATFLSGCLRSCPVCASVSVSGLQTLQAMADSASRSKHRFTHWQTLTSWLALIRSTCRKWNHAQEPL